MRTIRCFSVPSSRQTNQFQSLGYRGSASSREIGNERQVFKQGKRPGHRRHVTRESDERSDPTHLGRATFRPERPH